MSNIKVDAHLPQESVDTSFVSKMHRMHFSLIVAFSCLTLVIGMQDWNLILRTFDYNATDPDLLTAELRTTRKQPGEFALNGTAVLGVDLDDRFTVEAKIYRSPNGSGNYKATPYQIQKSVFCKFIENIYIPMIQDDLGSCSNLPTYKEKCTNPIEKGTYNFNMCTFSNAGMPSHVQPGFYKIVARIQSETSEFWLAIAFEAEPKAMM